MQAKYLFFCLAATTLGWATISAQEELSEPCGEACELTNFYKGYYNPGGGSPTTKFFRIDRPGGCRNFFQSTPNDEFPAGAVVSYPKYLQLSEAICVTNCSDNYVPGQPTNNAAEYLATCQVDAFDNVATGSHDCYEDGTVNNTQVTGKCEAKAVLPGL